MVGCSSTRRTGRARPCHDARSRGDEAGKRRQATRHPAPPSHPTAKGRPVQEPGSKRPLERRAISPRRPARVLALCHAKSRHPGFRRPRRRKRRRRPRFCKASHAARRFRDHRDKKSHKNSRPTSQRSQRQGLRRAPCHHRPPRRRPLNRQRANRPRSQVRPTNRRSGLAAGPKQNSGSFAGRSPSRARSTSRCASA